MEVGEEDDRFFLSKLEFLLQPLQLVPKRLALAAITRPET